MRATILKMVKMPDSSLRLLIQGRARIRLAEITQREPFIRAKIVPLEDEGEKTDLQGLMAAVKGIFQKWWKWRPIFPASWPSWP